MSSLLNHSSATWHRWILIFLSASCLLAARISASGLGHSDNADAQYSPRSQSVWLGQTEENAFGSPDSHHQSTSVYLETMEDLEQVAYLSMRNFNLTNDSLLQSSWLAGLANAPVHKQHQTPMSGGVGDPHEQPSLMLESFISHLRNGYLRRLNIEDLASLVARMNGTEFSKGESTVISEMAGDSQDYDIKGNYTELEESNRCKYLVRIYELELKEQRIGRQRAEELNGSTGSPEPDSPATDAPTSLDGHQYKRMMQLCQLAVRCHSPEQLVNLIRVPPRSASKALDKQETVGAARKKRRTNGGQKGFGEQPDEGSGDRLRPRTLRDSLSLSLAKLCPLILFQSHDDDGVCNVHRDERPPMVTVWGFATLFVTIVCFCSLIGLSITPFLGLSAAAFDFSGSSDDNGPTKRAAKSGRLASSEPSSGNHQQQNRQRVNQSSERIRSPKRVSPQSDPSQQHASNSRQRHHRACLNMFEGLAVGSLVGSALFSLIPQAFELQERESNQGFLLKALIIFFGIYLFFCSERLMRIILDTRQQRKRRKHLAHRSSNSIQPFSSTTVDNCAHLNGNHNNMDANNRSQQRHSLQSQSAQRRLQSQPSNQRSSAKRKNLSQRPLTFNAHLSAPVSRHVVHSFVQQKGNNRAQRQQHHYHDHWTATTDIDQHIEIQTNRPATATGAQERSMSAMSGRLTAPPNLSPFSSVKLINLPRQLNSRLRADQIQQIQEQILKLQADAEQDRTVDSRRASPQVAQTDLEFSSVSQADRQFRAHALQASPTRQQLLSQRSPGIAASPGVTDGKCALGCGASKADRVQRRTRKTRHKLRAAKRHSELPRSRRLVKRRRKPAPRNPSSYSRKHGSSHSHRQRYYYHAQPSLPTRQLISAGLRRCSSQSSSVFGAPDTYDLSGTSSHSYTCCSSSRSTLSSTQSMLDRNLDSFAKDDDNTYRSNDEGDGLVCERLDGSDISDESGSELARAVNKQMNANMLRRYARARASGDNQAEQRRLLDALECEDGREEAQLSPNGDQRAALDSENRDYGRACKQDISTVAWMIILGDGLDNFIDGISIGAAFSESILSGVSISVAVICEEFPHELGDFAVLVSSGMTVRQALGYNFLSACTCYLGMGVGIILGDVHEGASYISALTAGVFLYIALVDMMGELSATLEETSRESMAKTFKLLLLQNFGIFVGISIIFVLSYMDF